MKRRPSSTRDRRGIALVAALSLMTLLGLMIVGAIATTTIAERASVVALSDGALVSATDDALSSAIANPAAFGLADLPAGVAATIAFAPTGRPLVSTSVTATRGAFGLVWLTADAWLAADSSARRRVNGLGRFPLAVWMPRAPIVAGGPVSLAADVIVTRDSLSGADCGQPAADSVITRDSTSLYLTSSQRSVLDSATGIHVRGDTTVSGGSLDGLLIVDGNLAITGSWDFRGLAIVRGGVTASHGLTLTGALIAQLGADLSGALIRYSPCAIGQVVRRGQRMREVRGRSWVEMF